MIEHKLNILGTVLSFKAEAKPEQVAEAKHIIEERFEKLKTRGKQLSKEKLLTFLILSLADDFLQLSKKNEALQERLNLLIKNIDEKV